LPVFIDNNFIRYFGIWVVKKRLTVTFFFDEVKIILYVSDN